MKARGSAARHLPSIAFALILLLLPGGKAQETRTLAIHAFLSNGLPHVSVPLGTNLNTLVELETSSDLIGWESAGRFRRGILPYADFESTNARTRYYRARQYSGSSDWANQPWQSFNGKFTFLANEPGNIYFHDGNVFHYQFARANLPEFASLSPEEFDAKAIHPSKQEVVLGHLTWYGEEVQISFVNVEPFPKEQLARLFKIVAARVAAAGARVVLVPSNYDQHEVIVDQLYFEQQGIPIQLPGSDPFNAVHSNGMTVGRLAYLSFADLVTGGDRLLTPGTILVTDLVPRDLPPIAGLISLNRSQANSHSALRLQAQRLPYVDALAADHEKITNLLGKEVVFTAFDGVFDNYYIRPGKLPPSWTNYMVLEELGSFSPKAREELTRRAHLRTVDFPEMRRLGRYFEAATNLYFTNVAHFGSKAVNYGILNRVATTNSHLGIAISFDLWLDFMNQKLPSGKTLREEIDPLLSLASSNLNSAAAFQALKQVRDLIEDAGQFSGEQRQAITNGLMYFDPTRKIRFRSSSNVEDLPGFSAAGLHESYSGCLLDDRLPGPKNVCECDPADDKRRGVFRAIRKVFASFYNDQAFAERRLYGFDESKVGMAVLVHYSFPDEIELANGVATADFRHAFSPRNEPEVYLERVIMVTQRGAVSVANPQSRDLPETATMDRREGDLWMQSYSTIRPPQTPVLSALAFRNGDAPSGDYLKMWELCNVTGQTFPWSNYSGVQQLNFEYKKTPEGLMIKQVRPVRSAAPLKPAIFRKETNVLYTLQNEQQYSKDAHPLKTILYFQADGGVAQSNTAASAALFAQATAIYVKDGRIVTNEIARLSGGASEWTNKPPSGQWASFDGDFVTATNLYRAADGTQFTVATTYPFQYSTGFPFFNPSDAILTLSRSGIAGSVRLTPNTYSTLRQWGDIGAPRRHERSFETNSVKVHTVFWRFVSPYVPVVGIGPTDSLWKWEQTTITGLATEPIVLKGYFSQTYNASRHNFVERFLFEPRLEDGISRSQIAELESRNIRQVAAAFGLMFNDPSIPGPDFRDQIELVGPDGKRRPVPSR